MKKRVWGKAISKYCPVNKKVWQQKRDGTVVILHDMPTYGLDRKKIPNENN